MVFDRKAVDGNKVAILVRAEFEAEEIKGAENLNTFSCHFLRNRFLKGKCKVSII